MYLEIIPTLIYVQCAYYRVKIAFLCYCLASNKRVIAPKDDSALEVFETFFLCSIELNKLGISQCASLHSSVSGELQH